MHISMLTRGLLFLAGTAGWASAQFKYWNVDSASHAPKLLSATGIYVDLSQSKTMIPAAVPYEVNSPLWSDGSAKKRWVLLKSGTKIGFKAMDDYMDYPDSAVFIKLFAIDTVPGDTTSRRLWETRLLVLKKKALDPAQPGKLFDFWYGFSYRWRKDGKEADLVAEEGMNDTVGWYPAGRGTARVLKKWIYPSRDACFKCHHKADANSVQPRSVLGFFAAQLNRPSLANPAVNQIEELFTTRQILTGAKPANYDDEAVVPRWYSIESTDPKATLERKSRAYIAANCSGCHGTRGAHRTLIPHLNYDYHDGKPAMVFQYQFVQSFYGLDQVPPVSFNPDTLRYTNVTLVTPGYPQKSVLLYRQTQRNTRAANDPDSAVRELAFFEGGDQMPPVATFEVNTAAIEVIRSWIDTMAQTGDPTIEVGVRAHSRPPGLMFRGGNLVLPPGLIPEGGVIMIGIDGKAHALKSVGPGIYAIPRGLPKGVYVIRAGAYRFTRSFF